MHKRIRELAEQAEFSEKDLHIQGDNFQKFAELIVGECMSNLYLHGYDDARQQIQKHFGVESCTN